jgi:hypothetical protein
LRFDYDNPELQQALSNARSVQELDAALQRTIDLVPDLMVPEIRGRRLYCPGLDDAIANLPRRLSLPDVPLLKGEDNVCVLATRFYRTGGHSKVAADITRLVGTERVTLVHTDIYRQLSYSQLIGPPSGQDADFHRRATLLLRSPSLVEKIVELYMLLAAIRPSRIFLMGNHMDAVAVAGAWPFRSVVDYVHHADFMPAIGSSLRFSAHADLTYTCHLACREAGLDPTYAGMTVPAPAAPPAGDRAGGPLRIATCGSLHKYRHPGRYRWADFVIAALAGTGAEMIHIGPFDDTFAAEMTNALAQAGLDPSRYRFVGIADDLQTELARQQADIYLSSYPESGGRANLEAMFAGLPVIVPVEVDLGPLLVDSWPFANAVNVTSPAGFARLLLDSEGLIGRARNPANLAMLREQETRFSDYVAGRPVASIRPDDILPADGAVVQSD